MAVPKIITLPNPILRQKSKEVAKIDKKVLGVTKDLKDTLLSQENPRGIGISAPQIGKQVRIFLLFSQKSKKFLTFINPEIIWQSKRITSVTSKNKDPKTYEGCLSVPGYWGVVARHKQIKVRYLTPNNQTVVRKFSGFTGVVAQHEIDHLNGILFIDRILEQKGKLYKLEKNREGKDVFEEVKIIP